MKLGKYTVLHIMRETTFYTKANLKKIKSITNQNLYVVCILTNI